MTRLITVLSLSLLLAAPVLAQRGPRMGRRGAGGHHAHQAQVLKPGEMDQIAARLGLEPAVQEKVKVLVYAAEREGIRLRSEIKIARLELRRAMDLDQPDRAAVLVKSDELGVIEAAARRHRLALMIDVRALLTPAQVAELRTLRRSYRRAQRGRRGKRGKRGQRGAAPMKAGPAE